MPPKELSVQESAQMIVRHLLNVHPGENVVIVCDPDSEMAMAHALAKEVEQIGAEFTIAIMPNRQQKRANELPRPIAKGLEDADCLIGLTRSSGAPTYAKEVKALYNAKRLRTISMVMRDIRNFTTNGALADYRALYEEGKRLAEIWRKARRIRVQTPLGTDFIADIGKSSPIIECGFATEKGQEAAFPDGEVSQGPNEGTGPNLLPGTTRPANPPPCREGACALCRECRQSSRGPPSYPQRDRECRQYCRNRNWAQSPLRTKWRLRR